MTINYSLALDTATYTGLAISLLFILERLKYLLYESSNPNTMTILRSNPLA
jgi:hypothetical protein